MRNLKKVLALVIAFSMMLSVVAFAGYADVDADADYASAVELTSALGIFQGDENGNFNADKTITRAEMAAVIIRMQGLDAAAKASAGATEFADVAADHWASGYINLASQNGIIKGTGDGNFAPNDTLTYEAAVAMIVRALGFEPVAERKGGWTAGYVAVANSYKVTEGAAATATRGNLAILVANAMDTPMMDQTSYGSDEKFEVLDGKNQRDYRTLLTDMDVYVATGVVGAKEADEVTFDITEDSICETFEAKTSDSAEESFVIGESNILAYQNQHVDAYVLKDGRDFVVLAVVPSNVGETFEILSDDLVAHANGKLEYYVDAANSNKTKEIKVPADVEVEFNKGADTKKLADFIGEKGLKDVELVFIENTGDSTFDKVIATQYLSDVVSYVDAARDRLSLKKESTITFDFENEDATIILVDDKDNEITLEDLAEGDVVAIVADSSRPARYTEYIKVIKLANAAVEGSVDETYTSNKVDYIVIDGQEYPKAAGLKDKLEAGTEGIFYIGLTGKVIYFDGSAVGENYAYILEGAIANGAFTNDQWQLKLLTKDGVETFDIRKNSHADIADYIVDSFIGTSGAKKFIFDEANEGTTMNGKLNTARLVTYKLDGNGDIKELEPVTGTNAFDKSTTGEYNADAQRINKQLIEDDVVIFNVSGTYAKDAQVNDISYLVDEASYTGFVGKNDDDENVVMVITDLESVFTEDTGFAVVTKISTGKNEEGEEVAKITYVQNEEEGVITLDDDSELINADQTLELEIGTPFMFVADGAGLVSEYMIVATLESNFDEDDNEIKNTKKFVLTAEAINAEVDGVKLDAFGENTEFATGYILNEKYESTSKGEVITVGADTYVIRGTAYKYTYNAVGRNTVIEVADFMADADYKAKDVKNSNTWYASPVLLRIVDGVVVDVYGTTARIAQKVQ